MSGFVASNSQISITETVGTTEQSVFDTDHDMPHIVGTANQDVTVEFGDFPQHNPYWFTDYCAGYTPVYVCGYEYNCGYEYSCSWVSGYYDCGYSCGYTYGVGWSCDYVCEWVSGYTDCGSEYVCSFDYVCVWEDQCYEASYTQLTYKASNTENTQNICNLPTDEDGNTIAIDFVVVQATASRTLAGTDKRVSNSFLSTIPTDTFSFQGSMMLESSLQDNGDSWMKRIISVVVDNTAGKLKLKSKQTSAPRATGMFGTNDKSTASTYDFSFKVFFGRFKS